MARIEIRGHRLISQRSRMPAFGLYPGLYVIGAPLFSACGGAEVEGRSGLSAVLAHGQTTVVLSPLRLPYVDEECSRRLARHAGPNDRR